MKNPANKHRRYTQEDYLKAEDYANSAISLRKKGLVQLPDGGTCIRAVNLEFCEELLKAFNELDRYNAKHNIPTSPKKNPA